MTLKFCVKILTAGNRYFDVFTFIIIYNDWLRINMIPVCAIPLIPYAIPHSGNWERVRSSSESKIDFSCVLCIALLRRIQRGSRALGGRSDYGVRRFTCFVRRAFIFLVISVIRRACLLLVVRSFGRQFGRGLRRGLRPFCVKHNIACDRRCKVKDHCKSSILIPAVKNEAFFDRSIRLLNGIAAFHLLILDLSSSV